MGTTLVGLVVVLSLYATSAEIETMPVPTGADPIGSALIVPERTEEQLSFEATGAAQVVPTSSLPQRDEDAPRQWLDGSPSELPQVFQDLA